MRTLENQATENVIHESHTKREKKIEFAMRKLLLLLLSGRLQTAIDGWKRLEGRVSRGLFFYPTNI